MKNNDVNCYFSKIGKKLNIKYGNVFIKYKKKNKKLFNKFLRQKLDDYLLEENEKNKNADIFELLNRKRAKIMADEDDDNDSFYEEYKKDHINTSYKYHQLHLEKIERLKTSHFLEEKKNSSAYEPNYNIIKKRIITGPKWISMTGRESQKKIILDNSFSLPKQLKTPKPQKKEKIKKQTIKTLPKNHSSNNMTQKLKKFAKKLNLDKIQTKIPFKNKLIKSKIKKTTPKNEVQVLNVFPQLYTTRTYHLKENDIKDKYLKNVFLITSPKRNLEKKNSGKSYTKIFRNHEIGLNNEQIKAINDFRNYNKNNNIKGKIKKLKIQNILNKKYNLSLINIKNNFKFKNYGLDEDITGISTTEKSFNYKINKSLLEKNNKEIIRNNYKSLFLDYHKFKKIHEFYQYDIRKIKENSFIKSGSRSFRDIKYI